MKKILFSIIFAIVVIACTSGCYAAMNISTNDAIPLGDISVAERMFTANRLISYFQDPGELRLNNDPIYSWSDLTDKLDTSDFIHKWPNEYILAGDVVEESPTSSGLFLVETSEESSATELYSTNTIHVVGENKVTIETENALDGEIIIGNYENRESVTVNSSNMFFAGDVYINSNPNSQTNEYGNAILSLNGRAITSWDDIVEDYPSEEWMTTNFVHLDAIYEDEDTWQVINWLYIQNGNFWVSSESGITLGDETINQWGDLTNDMVTTSWVSDYINNLDIWTNYFNITGGTVTGDTTFENSLTVVNDINSSGDVFAQTFSLSVPSMNTELDQGTGMYIYRDDQAETTTNLVINGSDGVAVIVNANDANIKVGPENVDITANDISINAESITFSGAVTIGTRTNGSSIGEYSFAQGLDVSAIGEDSHAEGDRSIASADCSHAEGLLTVSSGRAAHAEGEQTLASGMCDHAEGLWTSATGDFSHSEGYRTIASGQNSHSAGKWAIASHDRSFTWNGETFSLVASNTNEYYNSHGIGTFNINPTNGYSGFYVGETNLEDYISEKTGQYLSITGGIVSGTVQADKLIAGTNAVAYGSDSFAQGSCYSGFSKPTITGEAGATRYYYGDSSATSLYENYLVIYNGIVARVLSIEDFQYVTFDKTLSETEDLNSVEIDVIEGVAYGDNSVSIGIDCNSIGNGSFSGGYRTRAIGNRSFVYGNMSEANALDSIALGNNATTESYVADVYVWSGNGAGSRSSHGSGTYSIYPMGGTAGFYIGDVNLKTHIESYSPDHRARIVTTASSSVQTNDYLVWMNTSVSGTDQTFTLSEMPSVDFMTVVVRKIGTSTDGIVTVTDGTNSQTLTNSGDTTTADWVGAKSSWYFRP